ncbi:cytochrome ubiquinol oxidase subunit I [Nonomuraea sp. B12E4]|uniref:cytochrome ubiquinol oxidase subunit I n=1 Tax=Nonomuraea sp. B12E4 TaxID=3153564 RepID=UPI00325F7F7D
MPVDPEYLLQARQMQAVSLAVHIPLVCFGIAFPAMVLLCEWRYLRTGVPLFRTLARRWSKVMPALFAVGVVTGTILSFELGLLWPEFMARFGNVFGLGFTLEGFSFFVKAITGPDPTRFLQYGRPPHGALTGRARHRDARFPIVVRHLLRKAPRMWNALPGEFV